MYNTFNNVTDDTNYNNLFYSVIWYIPIAVNGNQDEGLCVLLYKVCQAFVLELKSGPALKFCYRVSSNFIKTVYIKCFWKKS